MTKPAASPETIKVGNTLIFKCDEYRDGHICEFDGTVQMISEKGVEVIYLSGYKSRNDFIPWKDIVAKVDKRLPYVSLKDVAFSGHFLVFSGYDVQDNEFLDKSLEAATSALNSISAEEFLKQYESIKVKGGVSEKAIELLMRNMNNSVAITSNEIEKSKE